jgi:hypothetical protein
MWARGRYLYAFKRDECEKKDICNYSVLALSNSRPRGLGFVALPPYPLCTRCSSAHVPVIVGGPGSLHVGGGVRARGIEKLS